MSPSQGNGDQLHVNIAAALGADAGVSVDCIAIYIPNKDRDGAEIGNQRKWVLEALRLLGNVGGGATAMPPVEGVWLDDGGNFVWEDPVIVYAFVDAPKLSPVLPQIRNFLHRLGRETNQGEVVFEFGSRFFRIRTFDSV